jgi:plasmid maintenance system killer protein
MEEEMEELYAEGLATHGGHKLAGDRAGQYSIRINRQWRICFRWTDAGPEDVEITDYH